jgi:adenine-specific DNA-methyltransferase
MPRRNRPTDNWRQASTSRNSLSRATARTPKGVPIPELFESKQDTVANSDLVASAVFAGDPGTLGQHFTPRGIAELMVELVGKDRSARVLEPCSGAGVFLDVLLDRGFDRVSAVEVDPAIAFHPSVDVQNASFVSWEAPHSFDVVIGNPPYIRWRDLSEAQRAELRAAPEWGLEFNSLSDYLTVFILRSAKILVDGGELIFITPSFWMHTKHARCVREYLCTEGTITDVIQFGEAEVFAGVASSRASTLLAS